MCARGVSLSAFAFAQFFARHFQWWQDAKVGFHRLEVGHICVGDIMTERTEHGGFWQGEQRLPFDLASSIDAASRPVAMLPI